MPTLSERFAAFAHTLRYDTIPATQRAMLTRLLADALACALAAHGDPIAGATARLTTADPAGATLLLTGERAQLAGAALANTTAVRALDANDIYVPPPGGDTGHFSDAIPALLALAEAHQVTGADLLAGIAVAYETQAVLCDRAQWTPHGWHTASLVAWAIPVAAARLTGASPQVAATAMNIAGITGQALQAWLRPGQPVSAMKSVAPGLCASRAIEALSLAAAGVTAPSDALEVMLAQLDSDPAAVPVARLGQEWTISHTLIKRYPAQFNTQAAIQAALTLRTQGVRAEAIERLTITGHQHVCAGVQGAPAAFRPRSHEDADHSTPFVVAISLLRGHLTPADYTDEPWRAPEVLALMDRIVLAVDPERERARIECGEIGCRVGLTLRDGAEHTVEVRQPLGHPDVPMDDTSLLAKMGELLPGAGDACRGLLDACLGLAEAPNVAALLAACDAVRARVTMR
ncbi:MAG TPA: MmgE/PrpD family protein [Ktedonobacterales bacterium]